MTRSRWQSLANREAGLPPDDAPYEGVPAHLEQPLRDWVYYGLADGGATGVALRLRRVVDPRRDQTRGITTLAYESKADLELLSVIDAILALGGPWLERDPYDVSGLRQPRKIHEMIAVLDKLLEEKSSCYRVDDEQRGLTRRDDPTATNALSQAYSAAQAKPDAGSADDQIKTAWDSPHALHPDPPKAYAQAVRAVESAAHAIIEPNNPNATLGTMLGQMRNNPARYKLAIPCPAGTGDITPLIAMGQLLWQGQTRHGGQTITRDETLEEAQMAVLLAVTLVHWFCSGAVQRNR